MKLLIGFLLVIFAASSSHAALTNVERAELRHPNALAEANPGFESGKAQWTCTSGTFLIDTAAVNQFVPGSKAYANWDAPLGGAGAQCFSKAVKVPTAGNCEATLTVKNGTGLGTHLLVANDGINDLLTRTIDTRVEALEQRLIFPCPANGTARVGLRAVASNEPAISFDQAFIGRSTGVVNAAFATPTTPFTPTGSWTSNSTYTGVWWRAGDRYHFRVRVALSGAPNATSLTINYLTGGLSVDTAKMLGTTTNGAVPFAKCNIRAAGGGYEGEAYYNGTSLAPVSINSASTYAAITNTSATIPATFASGDSVECASIDGVPIVGWTASDAVTADQQRVPKVTTYDTVGGGTHTWSPGATYAIVEISGGGAGGSGGGAGSPGAGGNGGNSTFGSFITAGGGFSTTPNIGRSGPNGTLTQGPPAIPLNLFSGGYTGGAGACVSEVTGTNCAGGKGADSIFGAGGGSSWGQPGISSGSNGAGGGGGASNSATTTSKIGGGGGGAGAGGKFLIPISGVSISFTVGDGGAGGTAGTDGRVGGAGTKGKIVITEYFGATTALLANSVSTFNTNGSFMFGAGVTATDCTSTPCTLYDGSTPGVTITRTSTGIYSLNYASLGITKTPTCSISHNRGSGDYKCNGGIANTTAMAIFCWQNTTGAIYVVADSRPSAVCQVNR